MSDPVKVVTVDATNLEEHGFFCYKSKPKSEGYRRKLDWLEQRFAEGMKIHILFENGRSVGFIEYIPGAFAWRAVEAPGYMVIHCLWVVGRGKKKGYGSRLLNECVEEARKLHKHGVVMVTSSGNWLANKKLLLKNGFESVDQAPPTFELLVRKLSDAPSPSFPKNWEERLARCGSGITIFRCDQCPYIEDAVKDALEAAHELGIATQVVEMHHCQEVRDRAPTPYGVFGVVYNGRLLSYHYMLKKELARLREWHQQ